MGVHGAYGDVPRQHRVVNGALNRLAHLDGAVFLGGEAVVVDDEGGGLVESGIAGGETF